MFLSSETVQILKNLSTINQSILIKPGKTLNTMSVMKNILVKADIPEEFEKTVAIQDLNQFLNCLSLVPGAEVELGDSSITILVEKGEGLLKLGDLFFSQLISHFFVSISSSQEFHEL